MPRLLVVGWIALLSPAVLAQPKAPLILKGPASGRTTDQFFASGLATWAGQLSAETHVLKAELTAASAGPPLVKAADDALRLAAGFHRATLSTTDRGRIAREYEGLDASLRNLADTIRQTGLQTRGVTQSIARLKYADAQLQAALLGGDDWRVRVARLTDALSDEADELRGVCSDQLGVYDKALDRQVRAFASACSRLEANLDAGGSAVQLLQDYSVAAKRWQAAGPGLAAAARTDAQVRFQAARVDALFQQLALAVRAVPGIGPGIGIPPVLPGTGLVARGAAFAIGAGEGGGPRVHLYADLRGRTSFDFFAYDPEFRGGVRVALADLNGDGFPEIVTAPGPGMPPLVRVFDGQSLRLLAEFLAFDPEWRNGVHVAAADLTRTGKAIVVVGADAGGGPHVRAFDLVAGVELDNFFPYDKGFGGGVRVALGDVNGDGLPDLITVPGPGMPPRVKVYDGRNRTLIHEFDAYDPKWLNGIWIATADVTRNGRADLICGADAGGGPHVRVFEPAKGRLLGEFFPFPKAFTGGVRVAGVDVTNTGKIDILCAPGPSAAFVAPPIRVFDGATRQEIGEFNPFERSFRGGAYVGAK